jgi:D-glycero-alpha-D-manno-heptose-7-phosphate kinase
MIISRTPMRISLLGGGTDYPDFFNEYSGCVIGTTINKFVYVSGLPLPDIAEENYRFTYRVTESVQKIQEIKHPVLKNALSLFTEYPRISIATQADLPGRSGLGASSAFTVGLLNLLHSNINSDVSPNNLAQKAIKIEREMLCEPGGLQDQWHAAVGGFKAYSFTAAGVTYEKVDLDPESYTFFLLPFSGMRDSKIDAQKTNLAIQDTHRVKYFLELQHLTLNTLAEMKNSNSSLTLSKVAEAMREGWKLKTMINPDGASQVLSDLIATGIKSGALAGKLCGAGTSGFILFLVDKEREGFFLQKFETKNLIRVKAVEEGSKVIYSDSETD